ncbi:hypothetical protein GS399_05550 [Pedobacter sp. HMF7647]|uniref:Uncharacterized protein n=1 Tax=Hufsiella arboris TaxID=2695275 RepID=A0A7K1Y7T1_9SPHI|nr:hypothetical protein [Hufsiella arboris]MXV50431.1 hypothetical protein [Hufsiella arboris]
MDRLNGSRKDGRLAVFAGCFVRWMDGLSRRLAGWLNDRTSSWPPGRWKLVLGVFLVSGVCWCLYMVFGGFLN